MFLWLIQRDHDRKGGGKRREKKGGGRRARDITFSGEGSEFSFLYFGRSAQFRGGEDRSTLLSRAGAPFSKRKGEEKTVFPLTITTTKKRKRKLQKTKNLLVRSPCPGEVGKRKRGFPPAKCLRRKKKMLVSKTLSKKEK
jgi:hypothetical protein